MSSCLRQMHIFAKWAVLPQFETVAKFLISTCQSWAKYWESDPWGPRAFLGLLAWLLGFHAPRILTVSRIVPHFEGPSASLPTKAEQNPWQMHSFPSIIWKAQSNTWHSWDRLSGGIFASHHRCGYFLFKGTHWFFCKSVGYNNLKDLSHLSGENSDI